MRLRGESVRIIGQMAKVVKVNKHIATKEQRRAAAIKVARQSSAIEGIVIPPPEEKPAKRKSA